MYLWAHRRQDALAQPVDHADAVESRRAPLVLQALGVPAARAVNFYAVVGRALGAVRERISHRSRPRPGPQRPSCDVSVVNDSTPPTADRDGHRRDRRVDQRVAPLVPRPPRVAASPLREGTSPQWLSLASTSNQSSTATWASSSGSPSQTAVLMGVVHARARPRTLLYSLGDLASSSVRQLWRGQAGRAGGSYVLKASPAAPCTRCHWRSTRRSRAVCPGRVDPRRAAGAGTLAVSAGPARRPSPVTCVTGGTLGTAAFTFTVSYPGGSVATSAPVVSAAGWSSTGYQRAGHLRHDHRSPPARTSARARRTIYTISTLGAVAHPQGAGPAVPTFTASPVDDYNGLRSTITTGGANGTAQFTYSLDGGVSVNGSSAIVSPGGGARTRSRAAASC
jgi:hypothetical protein